MDDILKMSEAFKARMVARERRAASELVRAYGLAYQRIQERVSLITAEIDKRRVRGESLDSFLYERDRLRNLQIEIEREMRRFSIFASNRITDEQRAGVRLAAVDSTSLIRASLGSQIAFAPQRLNTAAVEALAGYAGDGSPLRVLFDKIAPQMGKRIADELVSGIAEGAHARVIASRVRDISGVGLNQALTISRTETIRAYRTAQLESYQANSDVVLGWRWAATLTPGRTCIVCWLMHGREFSTKVEMASHVNCRCVPIPVTVGTPQMKTGIEAFNELEAGVQRQMLGAAKYEAWQKGELNLNNLVGVRHSPEWGTVRFERSLKDVLG